MGIITGLLSQWRVILFAIALGAIAFGAWKVKSAFARAAEADRLETELDDAQKKAELSAVAYKKADQDRVLMSAQIADYQAQLGKDVETVIRRVPVYIKDDRQCDVPVEVLKDLNRALGQPE